MLYAIDHIVVFFTMSYRYITAPFRSKPVEIPDPSMILADLIKMRMIKIGTEGTVIKPPKHRHSIYDLGETGQTELTWIDRDKDLEVHIVKRRAYHYISLLKVGGVSINLSDKERAVIIEAYKAAEQLTRDKAAAKAEYDRQIQALKGIEHILGCSTKRLVEQYAEQGQTYTTYTLTNTTSGTSQYETLTICDSSTF